METFKKVVSYYLMIALLITMMPTGRLYAADGAIMPRVPAADRSEGEAMGPMGPVESPEAMVASGGNGSVEKVRETREPVVLRKHAVWVTPEAGGTLTVGEMRMEIPAGAVDQAMEISVEELARVPALTEGLENTGSEARGYRALPHGTQFKEYVRVYLPYDRAVCDTAAKRENLNAYFYDEGARVWRRLERVGLDEERGLVECVTTHFTDFITATLKMADSPKPLGFNPTSIKDIKAADPSAEVPKLEGLEANQTGSATFQIPLRIPAGRGGVTPRLALSYNSSGSSGWLGQGFDLSVGSISIDTSKRMPKFDGEDEYQWNGRLLVKGEETEEGTTYRPKVEGDFPSIVRTRAAWGYAWQVREKSGITTYYGQTADAVCGGTRGNFQWLQSRVEDPNGNYCEYTYTISEGGHRYLDRIEYAKRSGESTGFYRITFVNGVRNDCRITMRGGYKDTLDKRLERVEIRYCGAGSTAADVGTLVRSYEFGYIYTVFGKSQISTYRELDAANTPFYEYAFTYKSVGVQDGKVIGLSSPSQRSIAMGESFSTSVNMGANVSFGGNLYIPNLYPYKSLIGVEAGINVTGGSSDTYENAVILDVNGDGIADQITHNMKSDGILLGRADGSYERANVASFPFSVINDSMSKQTNQDYGFFGSLTALEVVGVSGSYTNGTSNTTTKWSYQDIDGDGLVDIVDASSGKYYKNKSQGKTVRFEERSYASAVSAQKVARQVPAAVLNDSPLLDPLRMWMAYRAGTIRAEAQLSVGTVPGDWDGITAMAYAVSATGGGERSSKISETGLGLGRTSGALNMGGARSMRKGDQLVFRQTSNLLTEGDEVDWDVRIRYQDIQLFSDLRNRRYVGLPPSIVLRRSATPANMGDYYVGQIPGSTSEPDPEITWTRKTSATGMPTGEVADFFVARGNVVYEKLDPVAYARAKRLLDERNKANLAAAEAISPSDPDYNSKVSELFNTALDGAYWYDPSENVMVLSEAVRTNTHRAYAVYSAARLVSRPGSMLPAWLTYQRDGVSGESGGVAYMTQTAQSAAQSATSTAVGYVRAGGGGKNESVFVERIERLGGTTSEVYLRPYLGGDGRAHVEVTAIGAGAGTWQDCWIDGATPVSIQFVGIGGGSYAMVIEVPQAKDQRRSYELIYTPYQTLDQGTGVRELIGTKLKGTLTAAENAAVRESQRAAVATLEKQWLAEYLAGLHTGTEADAKALWLEALAGIVSVPTPKSKLLHAALEAGYTKEENGSYTENGGGDKATLLWIAMLAGVQSFAGARARYVEGDVLMGSGEEAQSVSISAFYVSKTTVDLNLTGAQHAQIETYLQGCGYVARAIGDYVDATTNPASPLAVARETVCAANHEQLLVPDAAQRTAIANAIDANSGGFQETIALGARFGECFTGPVNGSYAIKQSLTQEDREFAFWWELCAKVVPLDFIEANPVDGRFEVSESIAVNPAGLFYLPTKNLLTYTGVTERLTCTSETVFTVREVTASGTVEEYGYGPNAVSGTTDAIVLGQITGGRTVERTVYVHSFDAGRDFSTSDIRDKFTGDAEIQAIEDTADVTSYGGGTYGWYYAEWKGYHPVSNEYSTERIKAQQAAFAKEKLEEEKTKHDNGTATSDGDGARRAAQTIWPMRWEPEYIPGGWHGAIRAKQETKWDGNAIRQSEPTYTAGTIGARRVTSYRQGGDEPILAIPQELEPGGQLSWIRKAKSDSETFNVSILGSIAYMTGSSAGEYDLMDMNGDRFPDMLKYKDSGIAVYLNEGQSPAGDTPPETEASVSYADTAVRWGSGAIREFKNDALTLSGSIGPGASQAIRSILGGKGGAKNTDLDQSTSSSSKISLSAGGGVTVGASHKKNDIIDMNGDGLPDYIYRDDKGIHVLLNDGQGFVESALYAAQSPVQSVINAGARRAIESRHHSKLSECEKYIASTDPDKVLSYSGNTSVTVNANAGLSLGSGGAAQVSIGLGTSVSTDRSYFDVMDLNGDGLPDLLMKDGNRLKVYFNLGDRFAEPMYWGGSGNDATIRVTDFVARNPEDNSEQSIPTSSIDSTVQENGVESPLSMGEEISASTTIGCSANGVVNVKPRILVFAWVTIIPPTTGAISVSPGFGMSVGGGVNLTNVTYSYTDVDGDGLVDNLVTAGDYASVRYNQTGRDGQLETIKTPQGGLIELEFELSERTTDDPMSRYNLTEVKRTNWRDETKPAESLPSNVVRSRYEYEGGYYSRNDRSFWGYQTVRIFRMMEPIGNDWATKTEKTYDNRDYYLKDKVIRETQFDRTDTLLYTEETAYGHRDYTFGGGARFSRFVYMETTVSRDYDGLAFLEHETIYDDSYDDWGNPLTVINKVGGKLRNTITISYRDPVEVNGHLIASHPTGLEVRGANGELLRKRGGDYDDRGRLTHHRDYWGEGAADALETRFRYADNGNLEWIRDAAGYEMTYTYDAAIHSRVASVADNLGQSTSWTYDAALGVELSQTDTNGKTISRAYDRKGRMIEVRSPYDQAGGLAALSFSYDLASYPWKAKTENKVSYDPTSREAITTVILVDGNGALLQTKKESEVTNAAGTTASGWTVSPWVVVDGLGRETEQGTPSFEEDRELANTGLYLAAIRTSFTDDDLYTKTTYDTRDRPRTVRLPDGSIQETQYAIASWDGEAAWQIRSIDPENKARETWVDGSEQTLAVLLDPEGERIVNEFDYDDIGQMLAARDDAGTVTVRAAYDALGRKTEVETPESGLVTYVYDRNGDLYQKVDPELRARSRSITYEYEYHRLKTMTYPDQRPSYPNRTVRYTYGSDPARNNVGRVIAVDNGDVATYMSYGPLGELTTVRRVIQTLQTNLGGDYDNTFDYEYNYLGQMTRIVYPGKTAYERETVMYQYDRGGQVNRITGTCLGRPVVYADRIGYDQWSQRVLMTHGNGTETTYVYDEARRWLDSQTTKRGTEVLQHLEYEFYKNGSPRTFTHDAPKKSYKQTYLYDSRDQLTYSSGTYANTSSVLKNEASYEQTYGYDRVGNMLRKTSTLKRTPAKASDIDFNYASDYLYANQAKPHQTTQVGDTHYVYDANGNLTQMVPDWKWNGGTRPGAPVIRVSETGDGRAEGDVALGLARDSGSSSTETGIRYLTWNHLNQLVAVSEDSMSVQYRYDADGERRLKVIGATETVYVDQMYEVANQSDNPVATINVYLGETRLVSKLANLNDPNATTESRNTFYYHADQLGNSSLITDYAGEEYERMSFTPHGEVWQHSSRDTLNRIDLLFTGKGLDAETGWYYFGARYLDPKTGLWLSGDPAMEDYIPRAPLTDEDKKANGKLPGMGGVYNPMNLATYHYAGNNPVKYIDPTGKFPVGATVAITLAVAWIVSSFGYDSENHVIYTQSWAFQKIFGYFDIYDKIAQIPFSIDCLDIPFKVDGKDYHIRAWKGHYLGAAGGEVGIYGGPFGGGSALTEKIGIQFTLKDKNGDVILKSPEKKQFWLFANKPFTGMSKYEKGSYTLTGTIDFGDRTDLADGFASSIATDNPAGFKRIEGTNKFEFTWQGEGNN